MKWILKIFGNGFDASMTLSCKIYQKAFGLHEYNGDDSNELPLAATYVIDHKGIIQYAFLDADYRNRAEPDEILKALAKLKDKK